MKRRKHIKIYYMDIEGRICLYSMSLGSTVDPSVHTFSVQIKNHRSYGQKILPRALYNEDGGK